MFLESLRKQKAQARVKPGGISSMAAAVWKGHLTFGLVSIPVRLVRAARAERVKLRQLYRPNPPAASERNRPAVSSPVTPVERTFQLANAGGQAVDDAGLVKGYEYSKGEYVVLEEQEIRDVAPKTSTEMQIVEFVRFAEIDPVYLETSYYVNPDESGEKSYALLFTAMHETGYAAIGQLSMHRRDHVMIVRPGNAGLIAHSMFLTDEVRALDEFRTDASLVSGKELELARALIQTLATSFKPGKFKNQFQERLRQLIESRAGTRQVAAVEPPGSAKVIDIMDALKRSLATAKSESMQRKPAKGEQSGKKVRTHRTQG
jgi:DNA end-binding protein Ku